MKIIMKRKSIFATACIALLAGISGFYAAQAQAGDSSTNRFFFSAAPQLSYSNFLGVGFGAGLSIGIDNNRQIDAFNIDYQRMSRSFDADGDLSSFAKSIPGVKITIHSFGKAKIDTKFIAATYDYVAKLGSGQFVGLIGTGAGLEVYMLHITASSVTDINADAGGLGQNQNQSQSSETDEQVAFGGLLLTPRIGFEWNITDLFAIGMNLRGFINLPAFPLSRGTLDLTAKLTF